MADKEAADTAHGQERVYTASQWQLMWWRFTSHKAAVISLVFLIAIYVAAGFCEFVAPHTPDRYDPKMVWAPPRQLHFVDEEGFHLRPFVYGYTSERDPETLTLMFEVDKTRKYQIHLFVPGDGYKFWGLWKTDRHLFGFRPEEDGNGAVPMVYFWGADRLGRDVLSRTLYGARVSLSIGLVGVFLSLILGVLLGGISGYYGGPVDTGIQRLIEFLRSLPAIPLWMTLAAAVPRDWPPLRVYLAITVILSFIGWTGLARVVRGKFLSLREEDFVLAGRLCGAGPLRIVFRHMVPSFTSHLIASLTLSIPAMILSETSLSFLGLGLRPPVVSWGVLLQDAQNIRAVALTPWLFVPGLAVILSILAFNFVGDGLRDAADPYAHG
jgi:peptide/nickel transport system permease protein